MFKTAVKTLALSSCLALAAQARASSNKDEVRTDIEANAAAEGWNVIWGEHIDHESYGWCIAGYLAFDTSLIQSCISVTFSPQILDLGSDVIKEVAQHWGERVSVNDFEYRGKIASYRQWKKTSIGKITLPNTHQPYILWRPVDSSAP